MNAIVAKINNEPVLAFALIQALIGLGVAFGFDLSGEQTSALLVASGAVLAIVCRGRVTPVTAPARDEEGSADLLLAVAILVCVVLLLFGVSFK